MDLELIETGNGGDLRIVGNDLAVVNGYENMPYLAMFGGSEFWGNDLLFNEGTDFKFSSTTEKVLQSVALNSAGRIEIEAAILADLAFIKKNVPDTKIVVSTSIVTPDRLDIAINIDGQAFYFEWNPSTAYLNYRV